MVSYGEKRWGKPPPGYVPGLGRGAVGFCTRLDVGPARNLGNAVEMQPKKEPEQENDMKDYSETSFNKFYGYEENLFSNAEYDEEDREADNQYGLFDSYMDERRKSRKEKKELENLQKRRNERPTIRQSFSDLRNDMKKLKSTDWEKIPDIKDYTVKKRKIERYTANTDRMIEDALNDANLMNQIPPISGLETPIDELGKAKNSVLSCVFDNMSGKVSGQTSVNPLGYLTEMTSNSIRLNPSGDVQDFKKARLLLKNLTTTNPTNVTAWIASARLEELEGKLSQARSIIAQAANTIFDSEDIWLEAARLHNPEEGKIIVTKGISHLPQSEKLWIAASKYEIEKNKQNLVLRKALESIPTSETIWKMLVELENEENAKQILRKACECVPHSIDMWLALAKLENYKEAQKVLNKARKENPKSHLVWIHAAKLEEAQNNDKVPVEKLISRGMDDLMKNDVKLSRDAWMAEAITCEIAGSTLTSGAIIKCALTLDAESPNAPSIAELKSAWLELVDKARNEGCIETSKQVHLQLLEKCSYDDMELWMMLINHEKIYGSKGSYESLLKLAVEKCPSNEIFWLMLAKHKWKTESIQSAKDLLNEALKRIENEKDNDQERENIILAMVKLEKEENNYAEAISILEQYKEVLNTERIWMNYVQIFREMGNLEKSTEICKEALEKFPQSPKLWMIFAQLKHSLNKKEEAIEIYKTGIEKVPSNPHLYICLSKLLTEIDFYGNQAQARAALEKGIKAVPKNESLWCELVRFELRYKNESNAVFNLSKGLKEIPNSGRIWSLAIEIEKPQSRHSKAFDALNRLPHDVHVMTAIAKIYVNEKKMETARKWFEGALRVSKDHGDTWTMYFKAEKLYGDESKAEIIKKKCEEAEPRHGEIWTSISKKVENWKLKPHDILEKASYFVEYD